MDSPSNISQKKEFSLSFFLLDIGKKEEKNLDLLYNIKKEIRVEV